MENWQEKENRSSDGIAPVIQDTSSSSTPRWEVPHSRSTSAASGRLSPSTRIRREKPVPSRRAGESRTRSVVFVFVSFSAL